MNFDASKIKALIALAFAAFGALYLGIASATAQLEAVTWIVAIAGFSICISLGRRIWLLLPFLTVFGLKLPLPGNLSTAMIAQAIVLVFLLMLFLLRKLPVRSSFTELEIWCLLFALSVFQAYARNPVGLNLFGGSSVGGKPYVEFGFTLAAALVLSILIINPNELKLWVRLTLIASFANFFIGMLGALVPSVGQYLGASFNSDINDASSGERDPEAANRVSYMRTISRSIAIWVSSNISPLKACFHPFWAPLVIFSMGAAAYTGYRSQFAIVGLSYFVGLCYRGKIHHLFISSILGALILSVLALVNIISPLPPNVQRSLTFLPGTWEERYLRDAEGSTDWRTEIWIEALTSDKYIRNKILGDGLGMNAEAFKRSTSSYAKNSLVGGLDAHRANIMMTGDFHSGPVQTIRTVGYVGLFILLIGLVRLSVHAHRQILRCRDTEWYPTALFIGIPIIWGPFFWTFIFGSFQGGFTMLFMGSAIVRLLESNLPLPAYLTASRQRYLLPSRKQLQTQSFAGQQR